MRATRLDGAPQRRRPQPRLGVPRQHVLVHVLREGGGIVTAVRRERRVAADLLVQVVLALPVPGEEDLLRVGVQVHDEGGDAAREVAEDLVEHHLLAAVHRLDPRAGLVLVPQRLVPRREVQDPRCVVSHHLLPRRELLIVGHVRFRRPDVMLDHEGVLQHRFHHDHIGTRLYNGSQLLYHSMSKFSRNIGRVKDRHPAHFHSSLHECLQIVKC
mmetsp:Transcript_62199/g.166907  ORF Transcript_62199/g.166907 Transcript_62199/m.166907 type:complete len:214 (+) Transcript_62199:97-738(+)